ncbi:MAG TPA: hypothetical protein G4O12_05815 [Dehalococcoidia bacterium]|nr:hypothetical protein [Dehalococcoidia bacterium]
MGWVKWLIYIASFFVPIFGFITFWVFAGRTDELHDISRSCIIASFFGLLIYIILGAIGVTMFNFLFQAMGQM